jgi:hypothetical protein
MYKIFIVMKKNIENRDMLKDLDIIKDFQLTKIKGGVSDKVEDKCGACCQLLGGGGGASKELD